MNTPRFLMIFLLLAGGLALPAAEAPKECVVCQTTLTGIFYWLAPPAFADRQAVCESCKKIPEHCSFCKLPVKDNVHRLDDGRLLCDRDFRAGIFDAREAVAVFEEAKRDVHAMLGGFGTLPDQNITVALADGRELNRLRQSFPTLHGANTLLGLTRTRISARKEFQHSIHLIDGLNRAELAAVSAHEFTHTWLHENIPAERKLEKDTVEGFCELVAYKLMTLRNEETQKRIILANAYTRGQVNAFVQAESAHHFHLIVQWLKTGVDESLVETNRSRVLITSSDTLPTFSWPPPASLPTVVPGSLMLKGISGTAARRFALINDATLVKNEETRIRVGVSNVIVRCLDIKPQSVVIQIQGKASPTELFLSAAD